MRGVTSALVFCGFGFTFQLTRLMRGVTIEKRGFLIITAISTHTPHARRDFVSFISLINRLVISTHTPHARRDIGLGGILKDLHISTHTPHARRDDPRGSAGVSGVYFNSHASCEA